MSDPVPTMVDLPPLTGDASTQASAPVPDPASASAAAPPRRSSRRSRRSRPPPEDSDSDEEDPYNPWPEGAALLPPHLPSGPPALPARPGDPAWIESWEERQRRQRSIRMSMLFCMTLLLLDGGDPQRQSREAQAARVRAADAKEKAQLEAAKRALALGKVADAWPNVGVRAYAALVGALAPWFEERGADPWKLESPDAMLGLGILVDRATAGRDRTEQAWARNVTGLYRGRWERHQGAEVVAARAGYPWEADGVGALLLAPLLFSASCDVDGETGRASSYLQMKPLPFLPQVSLVRGYVRLYSNASAAGGLARHKGLFLGNSDLLIEVKGVHVPALGRTSLTANVKEASQAVFMVQNTFPGLEGDLDTALVDPPQLDTPQLEAGAGQATHWKYNKAGRRRLLLEQAAAYRGAQHILKEMDADGPPSGEGHDPVVRLRKMTEVLHTDHQVTAASNATTRRTATQDADTLVHTVVDNVDILSLPLASLPFTEPAGSRPGGQYAVSTNNYADCEFEVILNADPVPLDNAAPAPDAAAPDSAPPPTPPPLITDFPDSLATTLNGTLSSRNCHFNAGLTLRAVRIDWGRAADKASQYSFVVVVACLVEIGLLLRQLHHTQSIAAASRVSLLCLGWQTVVDAVLCLLHVLFCVVLPPLVHAFASVAFFKLLIFCVIEMKYMAVVLQARERDLFGEGLRRAVAMLHARFYLALFAALTAVFRFADGNATVVLVALYSFWVPQICLNVVTEAREPLHAKYVGGMSACRLLVPLYIFGAPHSFIRDAYPEFQPNTWVCFVLLGWVAVQVALLSAQAKYGARFFVPVRFLPPKFDYSRPVPDSLLPPPPATVATPAPHPALPSAASLGDLEMGPSAPRQRGRTQPLAPPAPGMIAEDPAAEAEGAVDCVICTAAVDVTDPTGYMLAPCDHIFHKECLVQWMEVKMECPVCRMALPPI